MGSCQSILNQWGSDSIDFPDGIYGPAFSCHTADDRSIESDPIDFLNNPQVANAVCKNSLALYVG